MSNKELLTLIEEFIETRDDGAKDEWWTTERGISEEVMDSFKRFLEYKGKRTK